MKDDYQKVQKKVAVTLNKLQSAEQELQVCRQHEIHLLMRSASDPVASDELRQMTYRRSSLEDEIVKLKNQYAKQAKKLADLTPSRANQHLRNRQYRISIHPDGSQTYSDEDGNVITSPAMKAMIHIGMMAKVVTFLHKDDPNELAKIREVHNEIQAWLLQEQRREENRRELERLRAETAASTERTRQLMALPSVRCIDNHKVEHRLTLDTIYPIQAYPEPEPDDLDFDMAQLHFVFVRDDTDCYQGFVESRFASIEVNS